MPLPKAIEEQNCTSPSELFLMQPEIDEAQNEGSSHPYARILGVSRKCGEQEDHQIATNRQIAWVLLGKAL